ncbi:hypothetical protein Scep_030182 [Stephania cephalantha]|uniref:Uncharacterized protein n=1 Tax=Stephania cephalantha TaxID=152367 RepID=A0AAP0DZ93_9MAGN
MTDQREASSAGGRRGVTGGKASSSAAVGDSRQWEKTTNAAARKRASSRAADSIRSSAARAGSDDLAVTWRRRGNKCVSLQETLRMAKTMSLKVTTLATSRNLSKFQKLMDRSAPKKRLPVHSSSRLSAKGITRRLAMPSNTPATPVEIDDDEVDDVMTEEYKQGNIEGMDITTL